MLLPCAALGGAGLVVVVALPAQPTVLLTRGGQTAQLAVLVHRVADPVDAGVLKWEGQVGEGQGKLGRGRVMWPLRGPRKVTACALDLWVGGREAAMVGGAACRLLLPSLWFCEPRLGAQG